jgi:hypothetical protein
MQLFWQGSDFVFRSNGMTETVVEKMKQNMPMYYIWDELSNFIFILCLQ